MEGNSRSQAHRSTLLWVSSLAFFVLTFINGISFPRHGGRASLYLRGQTLPGRNFVPLVDGVAKCYTLFPSTAQGCCGELLGLKDVFLCFDRAQGSYQGQKLSPCFFSTNSLAGGLKLFLNIFFFHLVDGQAFPINLLLTMTLVAKSLLCFSDLEASLPFSFRC